MKHLLFLLILILLLLPLPASAQDFWACKAEGTWNQCTAEGDACQPITTQGVSLHRSPAKAADEAIERCELAIDQAIEHANLSGSAGLSGEACQLVACAEHTPRETASRDPAQENPACNDVVQAVCRLCGEPTCSRFAQAPLPSEACRQLRTSLARPDARALCGVSPDPAQPSAAP